MSPHNTTLRPSCAHGEWLTSCLWNVFWMIVLQRSVYSECNGSEKYWNLIDSRVEFIRSKANSSTVKIARYLYCCSSFLLMMCSCYIPQSLQWYPQERPCPIRCRWRLCDWRCCSRWMATTCGQCSWRAGRWYWLSKKPQPPWLYSPRSRLNYFVTKIELAINISSTWLYHWPKPITNADSI